MRAHVPEEFPTGPVRLIVLLAAEDAGGVWAQGVAMAWVDEFRDSRQDIYTLDDGQPVNVLR